MYKLFSANQLCYLYHVTSITGARSVSLLLDTRYNKVLTNTFCPTVNMISNSKVWLWDLKHMSLLIFKNFILVNADIFLFLHMACQRSCHKHVSLQIYICFLTKIGAIFCNVVFGIFTTQMALIIDFILTTSDAEVHINHEIFMPICMHAYHAKGILIRRNMLSYSPHHKP